MPVRKTESRLPEGFTAGDFGQSAQSADGSTTLISYIVSPIVINRQNTYVVFVTNATIAAAAASYEWTFTENGNPVQTETTTVGEFTYLPKAPGSLVVDVKIKAADSSEKASVEALVEVLLAYYDTVPGYYYPLERVIASIETDDHNITATCEKILHAAGSASLAR